MFQILITWNYREFFSFSSQQRRSVLQIRSSEIWRRANTNIDGVVKLTPKKKQTLLMLLTRRLLLNTIELSRWWQQALNWDRQNE